MRKEKRKRGKRRRSSSGKRRRKLGRGRRRGKTDVHYFIHQKLITTVQNYA
jgi:hypothetical protein